MIQILATDTLNIGREKINDNFNNAYLHESTQWSVTLGQNILIIKDTYFNLFSLFDNVANKVAGGTTSRSELNININGNITIPYLGKEYEGQRLHHLIRINFDFGTGNTQSGLCQLRRSNNTIIGSGKRFTRDSDNGNFFDDFVSYTNDETDFFVTIGFNVGILNNSDANLTLQNGSTVGVLVQTFYEKPTLFL